MFGFKLNPVATKTGGTSKVSGRPIYLDMQATTPMDPRVLDRMLPFLTEQYGNPHSRTHAYGWEAEGAVDEARQHVADLIGANEKDIVFTSGATESNNMIIKGIAKFHQSKRKHIITTQTVSETETEAEGMTFAGVIVIVIVIVIVLSRRRNTNVFSTLADTSNPRDSRSHTSPSSRTVSSRFPNCAWRSDRTPPSSPSWPSTMRSA